MVWVGRPLLLLWGFTALCLLSTSMLDVEPAGYTYTAFRVPVVPWYKTSLSAGEKTRLVYILNDVSTIWTKQYTLHYAPMSSSLVWLTTVILTQVNPVAHNVIVDPKCKLEQMNFQMVCQRGVVVIGSSSRLAWLVGIICISSAVSYVVIRVVYGSPLQTKPCSSLLLCSGAKYLFDKRRWTYRDGRRIGIAQWSVKCRNGNTSYVVDIKLWQSFAIDLDDDLPPRIFYAVPMAD
ncbi:hypothetical protein AaE_013033 [Aphanomyces astaci]|uniref:Uncharacterized protein n=1 Tax=Aphanomyces astaci TaxID=112090 RepID=A0A6A4Z5L8_APHAT|nr:hypothetical protein AaE_013033 [Aphanomyces astaci]